MEFLRFFMLFVVLFSVIMYWASERRAFAEEQRKQEEENNWGALAESFEQIQQLSNQCQELTLERDQLKASCHQLQTSLDHVTQHNRQLLVQLARSREELQQYQTYFQNMSTEEFYQ